MKISFLGGAETVTGSKYLVEACDKRILVDCGLFQGFKALRKRNWKAPEFDVKTLDAVILTHAHLDHSGYLPLLYKRGFRGPVYAHQATQKLCEILLPDSGHIQEQDAQYFAKHKLSEHEKPVPLYTREEAEQSLGLFKPVATNENVAIGDANFYLQSAGHILGACSVILSVEGKTIGFSGDVGRPDDVLMREPTPLPLLDLLLLESTYGDRRHAQIDPKELLAEVVNQTAENGGVLLIPSFAVGRSQTVMHLLTELKKSGAIPDLPVYLDSPMAINVSDIYCQFSEQHRLSDMQCRDMCAGTTYVNDVEESKALASLRYPHIIIAGSGMATGGRIVHHMKRLISNHRTTVLFTGYQAGGTRGAKMQRGVDTIKIHGKWIPLNARVVVLSGLSGHGDYVDIGQWLSDSAIDDNTHIKLVHGEPDALEGMRDHLKQTSSCQVEIAENGEVLHF